MRPRYLLNALLLFCVFTHGSSIRCFGDEGYDIIRQFHVDDVELPLIIEVSSRTSHRIVSIIMQILLREYLGYTNVRLLELEPPDGDNMTRTLQRISGCSNPQNCNGAKEKGRSVMINLETWVPLDYDLENWINTGEIDDVGSIGTYGRYAWFIANDTVNYFWESNNTIVDHWRSFQVPDIVKYFDITSDQLKGYMIEKHCDECDPDGMYRPPQCRQPDVPCATLLAAYPDSTFELLKSKILKLGLLVKVAWVGGKLQTYVEKNQNPTSHIVFYHYQPTTLSYTATNFTHVTFPSCKERIDESCEFEIHRLEKVVWSQIKTNAPQVYHVLKAFQLDPEEYGTILDYYAKRYKREKSLEIHVCNWMRSDGAYNWKRWLPEHIKKEKLYIGGIFPISGIYKRQSGVIDAAEMAAKAINSNTSLLPKYDVTILLKDGQCAVDKVTESFVSYVTNTTVNYNMIGILGPACTDTIEPIAGLSKNFNYLIISYSAEGSLFNDRDKYPYFFRTIPENNQFMYVYLKLFEKLKFTRFAALTDDGPKSPEYITHLQDTMPDHGMTLLSIKKFPRDRETLDLKPYLQDLISKGAKIIIGEFYDYAARSVMCEAFKLGMTAANGYVWFLPSTKFKHKWYDTDKNNETNEFEHVDCTTKQMISVLNGHIIFEYKPYADDDYVMHTGEKVKTWMEEYKKLTRLHGREVSHYGGYAYDAVWVYAYAFAALLKENNDMHISKIHSKNNSRRLMELISETNFTGISGSVSFLGSSRMTETIIYQWINEAITKIGKYSPSSQIEGNLTLDEDKIKWLTLDGRKPLDGSPEASSCSVDGLAKLLDISCDAALIVANIIGVSMFCAFVVSAIIIYKRRYDKKMQHTQERMKELGLMSNGGPFALDEWEMPRDHIVINRKLGEGAFGTVYGGEALIKDAGWIAVAVKTLKNSAKPEEKLDFLSEAEVMKQFDHVNIVKLVGVCTTGEPVYTVMEFMLYGDLKTYLLSRRSIAAQKDRECNDEVSDKRLTNMALDIARGLSYLADKKFVHRDLACRNCLVNISRSVKIADFGMCRAMYDSDYYRYNKKGMLPVRWMAPESLTDGLFTPMSDVWSYGIVLYEIVTFASVPYQGLSNSQVLDHIKNFNTLSIPKGTKPKLNALFQKCWSKVPLDRPQAVEIVEILAQNSELISPCLDIPSSSVEVLENENTLELNASDRARGHSLSSIWQQRNRQTEQQNAAQTELAILDTHQIALNVQEYSFSKHGLKFNNKKSFRESIRRNEKEQSKTPNPDIAQVSYF